MSLAVPLHLCWPEPGEIVQRYAKHRAAEHYAPERRPFWAVFFQIIRCYCLPSIVFFVVPNQTPGMWRLRRAEAVENSEDRNITTKLSDAIEISVAGRFGTDMLRR